MDGAHAYPFPEMEYYFLYQHLETGGFLILDDIHIPTVTRLFEFLREDVMFELVRVVRTTAFFRRTDAPLFNPYMDDWWLQQFNKRRYPNLRHAKLGLIGRASYWLSASIRERLAQFARRHWPTSDPTP